MNKFFPAVILALSASLAYGQTAIKIATGGPTGTYTKIFANMATACGEKVPLVEVRSGGSDDNIGKLVEKEVDAAFVQTDTLQFTAMNDPRAGEANLRTLVPLYPEEVHVVAVKDLSKITGGFALFGKNFGGQKQTLDSLADLSGAKVGAWGGSITTARMIAALGGVQYETVTFKDDKEALAALNKGEIAAIIAVGGQPLGFVKGLNDQYKLLKIDGSLASKVKAYQSTKVSYKNLNMAGLETVAARSILVVKNYQDPARKQRFADLKACLIANEVEFKEGTGMHAKWSDVDLKAPTVWAMYDIPAVAAPAVIKGKK